MPPLSLQPARIFRTRRQLCLGLAAAAVVGLLSGCATPGPLHVYAVADAQPASIGDLGPEGTVDLASHVAAGETVTGLAYDPFTDHVFLRLAPGNRLRVVDRPARSIKREFVVPELPATGGGDLTVRPRSGHLFLLHPAEPRVFELTRLGKFVREFAVSDTAAPLSGIAHDPMRNRLLLLHGEREIAYCDLEGRSLGRMTLERRVTPSLGYDGTAREIYAPLSGQAGTIGVFDENGRLVRTIAMAAEMMDVGERSFLRLF